MLILESTRQVVENARHVSIDDAAILSWAGRLADDSFDGITPGLLEHLPGTRDEAANFVLLLDSLNFCFWSPSPIRIQWRGNLYERYNAMLVSLMLAARSDARWFDARYWLLVPAEELRQVLGGTGELLLMRERERVVRETARVLLDRYDGQFFRAAESVNLRAWPLAVLLMTNFESFRDVSRYGYKPVYFMKRAQICAMDLSAALKLKGHDGLEGLEELTAFADYRVPQALRHLGILKLSSELAARIEREEEIDADSPEEVEIRAATIQAVNRMVQAAQARGHRASAWQVDCSLWEQSHASDVRIPHHRTRTIYY